MPDTTGARKYKRLLGVIGVASIVGIVLAVGTLIDTTLDWRVGVVRDPWRSWTLSLLHIATGLMACTIAYRGIRHNRAPSTLTVWIVVLLSTAAVLVSSLAN